MADIFRSADYARVSEERRIWQTGTAENQRMFGCKVCGEICASSPGFGQAVCETHCEDHDYEYERGMGGHFCKHCSKPVPPDWYDP